MKIKDPQFLYLTTIGNVTGKPHEIEIWFAEHDGRYYLVAEHRERSHWVKNIQKNPEVTFYVHGQEFKGKGRVLNPLLDVEVSHQVAALFDKKYQWSEGLIVELAPEE